MFFFYYFLSGKPLPQTEEKQKKDDKIQYLEISLNEELDYFPAHMAWKMGKPRIDRRWTEAEIIIPSSSVIKNAMTRL